MGVELDPAEISGLLKIHPDLAHKKGDPRIGNDGNICAPWNEGIWCLESDWAHDLNLQRHVETLLGKISGRESEFETLKKIGHRMDIFFGIVSDDTNFEFMIGADLAARLGSFGLDVAFDVYGPLETSSDQEGS